jgi:DNA-binding transcriptional regulator PaaX
MGEIENILKKKQFISNIQTVVLRILAAGGILSISLIAPNIFKILKYTNLGRNLYKKTYTINRSVQRLVNKGFVKFEEKNGSKFIAITSLGKKYLEQEVQKGGVLKKKWDKKWRIVIFDIHENKKQIRDKLRNTLISIGFYRLQNSVWVYPHDCEDLIKLLKADLEIGKEILYIISEHIEYDKPIREYFGLK